MTTFFQYVLDNQQQLLTYTLQHLRIGLLTVSLAIAAGVPLGLLVARVPKLARPVLGCANILQSIPSLAFMGLFIPIIGIGDKTAIVIIALYALMPIIKNTYAGLTNIDSGVMEAAEGIGMKESQLLFRVRFPLAMPVIMAGIRIAAVSAIGNTTIAAFIGGGGLGRQIYAGIQIISVNMILAGAIPACLLALLVDFLFGIIEKSVVPISLNVTSMAVNSETIRHMKKQRRTVLAVSLAVIALLFGSIIVDSIDFSGDKKIVIGSKEYIEVRILNELYAQLIEENTDIKVERQPALGDTLVVWQAIKNGDLDIVPDYTGTYYSTVLELPFEPGMGIEETYHGVVDTLPDYSLNASAQLGPNNAYVFACSPAFAEKYGVKTVSDLAPIAHNFTVGCSQGFYANDKAGLFPVCEYYGMSFKDSMTFGAAPMYLAHESGEVDVIITFATDGLLQKYDLVFLDDDKNFFPPYVLFTIYNDRIKTDFPEVVVLLNKMDMAVTDEEMQNMNYRGAELEHSPYDIARDFLLEKGLIPSD